MSCQGCFGGCVETTSDKCVKYTGDTIESLEIENGDSLFAVENAITTYLLTVMNGTGIFPVIDSQLVCTLVSGYLPSQGTITLVDILIALVESACDLQTQVTAVANQLTTLEDDYTVSCLSVSASAGTHAILQTVITFVCSLSSNLIALSASLADYVAIADLDGYITAYLAGNVSTKYYTRMVPFTVVEYYGGLGNFDASGKGIGNWEKIYLCNGENGTPDKRGFSPVGAINMVGAVPLDTKVIGLTYTSWGAYGDKQVTLGLTQIPSHTHATTSTITDPGHKHTYTSSTDDNAQSPTTYIEGSQYYQAEQQSVDSAQTGITVNVSNSYTGGGQAHDNIPPVRATYYVMYIP